MKSLMLQAICRFISPFLLIIAVYLLLRGHHEPGGGFAGGLVAASAFALIMLAFGKEDMRHALRFNPISIAGVGLLVAILSGVPALFNGGFLDSVWLYIPTPFGSTKLGTPFFFDIGVFLIVVGITVSILEDMAE